ncbi:MULTISPECIES: ABC transporter substrate-binding protein [Paenibacillus]|uniref:ABC transporter substrate-binding protein n=1 Tax=Paenibacillus validus TaxID=44253 RepID=A0A7X2Z9R7_9BACL|nr:MULTISPECIES: ABC transporter substrate-binding protein [Paenibacillus]MUG70939.1 ABC transporter substrate-binding protein [Paenibacillus validus]
MKKTRLVMIVALLVSVFAAGCGNSSSSSSEPTIVIGETEPLSGPLAVYGVPQNNSIKLAVKHINERGGIDVGGKKHRIELVSLDDQFNPTTALSNIKKMVEHEKIQFLVGFMSGSSVMPAFPYIKENKLPTLVGVAPDKAITATNNPYVFHVRPPSDFTGLTSGRFIGEELNVKTMAVVGTTAQGFFKDLIEGVQQGLQSTGGSITTVQGFKVGDQDITAQLTAAIATKPDAIYVGADVESAAFVYKQAKELGYKGRLLGFNGGSKAQFEKIVSADVLEGIYDMIPAEINPSDHSINGPYAQTFLDKYKAEYNVEAPPSTGYGYDLMNILAAAIEQAGTTDADAVVKALNEMPVPKEHMTMKWIPVEGKMFDKNNQAYVPNASFVWTGGDKKVHKEMNSPVQEYSEGLAKIRNASK